MQRINVYMMSLGMWSLWNPEAFPVRKVEEQVVVKINLTLKGKSPIARSGEPSLHVLFSKTKLPPQTWTKLYRNLVYSRPLINNYFLFLFFRHWNFFWIGSGYRDKCPLLSYNFSAYVFILGTHLQLFLFLFSVFF